MNVAKYVEQGMVVRTGDLYSCVGECNDFIVNDDLSDTVFNNIANIVAYSNDFALPNRNSEDKSCNNFGRKLPDLCKASGLRMCNGRAGIRVVGLLFFNHLGSSVIDYVIVHNDYDFVSFFSVLVVISHPIELCLRSL